MLPLLNFQTQTISRDRLFFDQYKYCMTAGVAESGCLRQLTHARIDDAVSMRQFYSNQAGYIASGHLSAKIPQLDIENLHKICQLLLDTLHPFKLIVEFGGIRLYSSNESLFDELTANAQFKFVYYTQAVVDRARNTVALKNPQHQYRSYFARAKLTDQQKQSIVQFLNNNRAELRLSPCLADWTTQPFKWTEPYYFIDHNNTACLTMLSLLHPRLIKKTNTIVQG
jgi:hypothetical protein